MPQWIHARAERLQQKNPDMPESEAWAIATQQSHAGGHTPKGYGTVAGRREARKKYDGPRSSYQKTAGLPEAAIASFLDELAQIEKEAGWFSNKVVLPLALATSLGGGVKAIQHVASKAPAAAAAAAKAPVVARGMGGFTQAAKEVREFMP